MDPIEIINNTGDFLADRPDELRQAVKQADPKGAEEEQEMMEIDLLADDLDILYQRYVHTLAEIKDKTRYREEEVSAGE